MTTSIEMQSAFNATRAANIAIRKRVKRLRLAAHISLQLCAADHRYTRKVNRKGNPPAEYSEKLAMSVLTFYGAWLSWGVRNPDASDSSKVKYGYRPRPTTRAEIIETVYQSFRSNWLAVRDDAVLCPSSVLALMDQLEADETIQAILKRHDDKVAKMKAAQQKETSGVN